EQPQRHASRMTYAPERRICRKSCFAGWPRCHMRRPRRLRRRGAGGTMPRTLALLTALSLSTAAAADEAQTHAAAYAYLIGTWQCAHQVGDFSGRYTTTYAKTLGDHWIRQTYEFEGAPGKPNWQAEALMTWVASKREWARLLALSGGEQFSMRLT